MANWKTLKKLFCRHFWNYGLDVPNKNKPFRFCSKCKSFQYVKPKNFYRGRAKHNQQTKR